MTAKILIYTIISFITFFISSKISYNFHLVDLPKKRKVHAKPTAYTGGIIISIILVTKFNLNVSGVAFGTLISSYAAAIASLVFVYNFFITKLKVIPKLKKNLFNIKKIIKILTINLYLFIITIFLTF